MQFPPPPPPRIPSTDFDSVRYLCIDMRTDELLELIKAGFPRLNPKQRNYKRWLFAIEDIHYLRAIRDSIHSSLKKGPLKQALSASVSKEFERIRTVSPKNPNCVIVAAWKGSKPD